MKIHINIPKYQKKILLFPYFLILLLPGWQESQDFRNKSAAANEVKPTDSVPKVRSVRRTDAGILDFSCQFMFYWFLLMKLLCLCIN